MDITSKEKSILKLKQLLSEQENKLYNSDKNDKDIQTYFQSEINNKQLQINALNKINQYLDSISSNLKNNTLLLKECINDKKIINNQIHSLNKEIQKFQ